MISTRKLKQNLLFETVALEQLGQIQVLSNFNQAVGSYFEFFRFGLWALDLLFFIKWIFKGDIFFCSMCRTSKGSMAQFIQEWRV